jgi:hypothetical protein
MTHARPRSRYRAPRRPRARIALAAAAGALAATAAQPAAVLTTFGNPHALPSQGFPTGLPPGAAEARPSRTL